MVITGELYRQYALCKLVVHVANLHMHNKVIKLLQVLCLCRMYIVHAH